MDNKLILIVEDEPSIREMVRFALQRAEFRVTEAGDVPTARVKIAEAHPDSTDAAWQAVDVAAVEPLPTAVGLDRIKADKRLAGMPLVRLPRLSVQPVTESEWRIISQMGGLR